MGFGIGKGKLLYWHWNILDQRYPLHFSVPFSLVEYIIPLYFARQIVLHFEMNLA